MHVSIVIPAKNESGAIASVVAGIREILPEVEIVVVDDGSDDDTALAAQSAGSIVVRHPYSKGNGAAIKSGFRAAQGDIVVFMDGDGQHQPADILNLLQGIDDGYDMVVGARQQGDQASVFRGVANGIYNKMASYMTGHKIQDLTSGFRAVKADKFREFIHLLPNGFSYPTTSTMAFFRAGYSVLYKTIKVEQRIGKSHISLLKDGVRFLLIIFKVGILYSPLKVFAPISAALFSAAVLRYIYTYSGYGAFTNMSSLLFSTSLLVFLIGLVSEQITTLIYLVGKKEK